MLLSLTPEHPVPRPRWHSHAYNRADLYRLAVILLPDRHDLIHKAVGWSLREAGKRVDRDELRRFLDQHATIMPRTALRYAIEHFEPAERQRYLAIPRRPGPA